jgi:phospho-N-acetylmuramoyl-pentapeptide-transferase
VLYWLLDSTRDWLTDLGVYRFGPGLLDSIQFRALAAVGVAFALVLAFGRRTIATLMRLKIGDSGLTDAEALRKHSAGKANTPTMGGVLIAGAIMATVLLLADLGGTQARGYRPNFYIALGLVVLVWLAVLGGFDDWLKLTAASRGAGSRQGLLAWEKLVFQLGLGLLVGIFAYSHGVTAGQEESLAHALNLPFQKTYETPGYAPAPGLIFLPQWAFIALSVLMIAGMSNAVNITDGMDGLATGVTGIATLGLMPLAFIAGTQAQAQHLLVPFVEGADELTVLAGAMLGACLGFLWWNCSPAQVFMGDTGSLCLGGLIGYIAVVTRQEAVVLLMSGVFLVEIGSVAMQVGYFKATKGKRIFRCAPYHHHLHMGGWTEQKVVARFWIISVLLVVAALASLKLR